jgi:hypothetical protein
LLVCCALAPLVVAPTAPAVINDDDHSGPSEGPCALGIYDFKLEGTLVVQGIPFSGGPIKIDATTAKLVGTHATQVHICDGVMYPVTQRRWSVVSTPPGQSASIADASTLTPSVNVGGPGQYKVRLTACASGCRITQSGKSRTIGPFTREVTIDAVSEYAPPPETQVLPPSLSPPPPNWQGAPGAVPTYSQAFRESQCQGGGGFKDPQWVTAQKFNGANDYKTVEGEVLSSHISAADDFLNHDSQDHNWIVKPDAPFLPLKQPASRDEMEMELETNHLPRELRPTSGDRAATIGYWIFDCGHEFQTEIHPAVGLAVQRPRYVQVPPSFHPPGFPNGMGSNITVPGVVTDVQFNPHSGEITNDCSTTGLHQPPVTATVTVGNPPHQVQVKADGPCIREPHPLNRRFTFNVYLPRNPQLRARELGLDPPAVPLYVGPQAGPGGGPGPAMEFKQDAAGHSWLQVTFDLTNYTGNGFSYRIAAAWAYPQPQNWGAKRWRVHLSNFKVYEDAEPDNPGPDIDGGDWRVYFNVNNRDREWTRVFKCDGCVDEGDVKNLNMDTGGSGLGPDPVLFPGESIFIHTTGYDDEVDGDDIGTVFLRMPQRNTGSDVTAYSQGGAGIYHLNFSIRQGAAVPGATLTSEATQLLSAYTLRARPQCLNAQVKAATTRPVVARPCGAEARDPSTAQDWHPDNVVLGTGRVRTRSFELFHNTELERHAIQGISVAETRRLYNSMTTAERNRLFAEMRDELRAVPLRLRGDYDELVATLDQALPAAAVRRLLPPGFRGAIRFLPPFR